MLEFITGIITETVPEAAATRLTTSVQLGLITVADLENSGESASLPPLLKLIFVFLTEAGRPMTRAIGSDSGILAAKN